MPWTDEQHRAAVGYVRQALDERANVLGLEVDASPRVLDALALENTGATSTPTSAVPLTGNRLERALRTGRYERWSTIVWRCKLAATLAASDARRRAFTSEDPLVVLEDAGLISREEAERRAQALRDGQAAPMVGNRQERRAAQRAAHRAAAKRRRGGQP